MNEDALRLIDEQARKSLDAMLYKRILALGVIFGIANIGALWAVIQSYETVVDQTVRQAAKDHADDKLREFTIVTETAKKQIEQLHSEYGKLYLSAGGASVEISNVQKESERLKSESAKLALKLEELSNDRNIRLVGDLVRQVERLPSQEANSLLNQLASVPTVVWRSVRVERNNQRRTDPVPFSVDFAPQTPRDPVGILSSMTILRDRERDLRNFNATITNVSVNGTTVSGNLVIGLSDDDQEASNFNADITIIALAR